MQNLKAESIPFLERLKDEYQMREIKSKNDARIIMSKFLEDNLGEKQSKEVYQIVAEVLHVERVHMINQMESRIENIKAFEI